MVSSHGNARVDSGLPETEEVLIEHMYESSSNGSWSFKMSEEGLILS